MKKLEINFEKVTSLFLTGGLVLCMGGCSKRIETKYQPELTPDTKIVATFTNDKADIDLSVGGEYLPVENNNYTLFTGANIYYVNGDYTCVGVNENLIIVTRIEANEKYSKIQLPDGNLAYVDSAYLIECADLSAGEYTYDNAGNNEYLLTDAYLYDENGMYIGYVRANQMCTILGKKNRYMNVMLDDGRSGYIVSYAISDTFNEVKGFAYVKSAVPLYSDSTLTNIVGQIEGNKVIGISSFDGESSRIVVDSKQYYVRTSDALSKFIIVDLNRQRIACYIDYQLVGCWKTRTGKLSTPTHEGAFDIDDKIADFWFPKYPGAHATRWMPINEFEEGLHDLVGDDEENYGNQAYQLDGSHGCIRVPNEAINFIYDNYDIGDMVIVISNSQLLLYNAVDNELIILDTESFNQGRNR